MSGMYVNASLSLIGLCALTGAGVAIGSGESLTWVLGMLSWCKLLLLYLALTQTSLANTTLDCYFANQIAD